MCYVVPTAGAVITSCIWSRCKSAKVGWLNLMFWGGALFGIIDHLWNGELFFISKNVGSDLLLGVVITLTITSVWAIAVVAGKRNRSLAGSVQNRI